ncbi:MAG TPA: hypothetical protein VFZ49_03030 [Pyrinomonadaceae bacterium]
MTTDTELRLALLEHGNIRLICTLPRRRSDQCHGIRFDIWLLSAVGGMAIGTSDVVAPVLTPTEVIMSFLSCVTGKAGLGDFLRILVDERDDRALNGWVLDMLETRTVARLTTLNLAFPRCEISQFGVFCLGEPVELVFVTAPAGFASDVIVNLSGQVCRNFDIALIS